MKNSLLTLTIILSFALSACGNPIKQIIDEANAQNQKKLAALPECKITQTEFKAKVDDYSERLDELRYSWAISVALNENKAGRYCGQTVEDDQVAQRDEKIPVKGNVEHAAEVKAFAEEVRAFVTANPDSCKISEQYEKIWYLSKIEELLPKIVRIETYFKQKPDRTPTCEDLFATTPNAY